MFLKILGTVLVFNLIVYLWLSLDGKTELKQYDGAIGVLFTVIAIVGLVMIFK